MTGSVLATIRNTMVPIHREGYPFIAISGAVALLLAVLCSWLFWPVLILTAWIAFFFRDPPRVTPIRPGLVVSPADGTVSLIADAVPPPELGLGDTPLPRVSVFMNVFNCHVNRSPVSGRIKRIVYRPGKFLNAELDKASEHNERNGFLIDSDTGVPIGVVQIAGLVARRIVCFTSEGQPVASGERIGLIRFGSRLDVYLPAGTAPMVTIGQTAVAGETVIADLASDPSREQGRSWRVN